MLAAGIEVSIPLRDRGIDLIAYLDVDQSLGKFVAIPIQLKAATGAVFSIDEKYAKFHNMVIAYVWNASQPSETRLYLLSHREALRIAEDLGFTKTESWRKGRYVVTRPTQKLVEKMEPYLATPAEIRDRLTSCVQ